MRNTTRHIQVIIATIEDVQFTHQDIYLTYTGFKYTFGSIDHPILFALREDLGYPPDAIALVGDIYVESSTFCGTHFTTTPLVENKVNTVQAQGDHTPYVS